MQVPIRHSTRWTNMDPMGLFTNEDEIMRYLRNNQHKPANDQLTTEMSVCHLKAENL